MVPGEESKGEGNRRRGAVFAEGMQWREGAFVPHPTVGRSQHIGGGNPPQKALFRCKYRRQTSEKGEI